MTHHISIDIECASVLPDAAMTQIGVAVMDSAGNIEERLGRNFKIDITDYDEYPDDFSVQIHTMLWWATQDPVARNAAFGAYNPNKMEDVNVDRQSLYKTMEGFCEHIKSIPGKVKIWAKPPSFDLIIIQHALKVMGFRCPWHFRDERCLRTLLSQTPKDASIHGMPFTGNKHDAYDDAVHQLRQVRACLIVAGRIRG